MPRAPKPPDPFSIPAWPVSGTMTAPWKTSALVKGLEFEMSSLPDVHVSVPRPPLRECEGETLLRLSSLKAMPAPPQRSHKQQHLLFTESGMHAHRAARAGSQLRQALCLRLGHFAFTWSVGQPALSPAGGVGPGVPWALDAVWGLHSHLRVMGKRVDIQ